MPNIAQDLEISLEDGPQWLACRQGLLIALDTISRRVDLPAKTVRGRMTYQASRPFSPSEPGHFVVKPSLPFLRQTCRKGIKSWAHQVLLLANMLLQWLAAVNASLRMEWVHMPRAQQSRMMVQRRTLRLGQLNLGPHKALHESCILLPEAHDLHTRIS